jgi:hypothetical protein
MVYVAVCIPTAEEAALEAVKWKFESSHTDQFNPD